MRPHAGYNKNKTMKMNHAAIAAISLILSTWTLTAQDNQRPNPPAGEGQPHNENATRPDGERPHRQHRHRDEAGQAQSPDTPRSEAPNGGRPQQSDRPPENQRPQNAERPNRDGGNFAPRGEGRRWQRGERPFFGPGQNARPDGPQRNFAPPPPPQQQAQGDGRRLGHHRHRHHKWQDFGGNGQQYGMERPRRHHHRDRGPQPPQDGPGFAQQGGHRMDARSQGGHPPFAGRPSPQEMQHLFEMMRERWAQGGGPRGNFRPQPPQDGPRFQQQGERRMDARSQNWRPRFDERPDFQQRGPRFEGMHPQGPGPMNEGRRDMRQGPPPPQWDRFAPPPREDFAPPQGEREQFRHRRRSPQDDWQGHLF